MVDASEKIILAVPKGRIFEEIQPVFEKIDLEPEPDFFDENSRKLRFTTNHKGLDIIRVRAFDVATFVAYGAAQIGVAGSDVIEEFDYPEVYAPVDFGIGRCRLSIAAPPEYSENGLRRLSHVRVATKYPQLTARHFARAGIHAECINLGGAMEIAPALSLAPYIVDLVSSGQTLAANQLVEIERIMEVSARLIVNRSAFKTDRGVLRGWIGKFNDATS